MKHLLLSLLSLISLSYFAQDTTTFTFRFPSDDSQLSPTQVKSIDSLILSMDGYAASSYFYIQGHTDNIGNRKYNERLSEKRSRSVRNSLLKKGISKSQIEFEYYGFDAPIASNENETGRADNRRTTLSILTKIAAPNWDIPTQAFKINPNMETILKTKNGCKVIVPENAFVLPDFIQIPGKIIIEVKEYNNPAYFIASGIPMSYKAAGQLFVYHSEEMLSIKAFYNSVPLELKNDIKLTLNCKTIDSLHVTGFYKFDLEEKKWFEEENKKEQIRETPLEKKTNETTPEKEVVKENSKIETTDTKVEDQTPSKDDLTNLNLIEKEIESEKNPEPDLDTAYFEDKKIDTLRYYKKRIIPLDSCALNPNCCAARAHIARGGILSETPFDLMGVDAERNHVPFTKVNQEYVDQILRNSEYQLTTKKYYHIKLRTKKLFLRRKAILNFSYNKSLNPELKELRKVVWVYRFKSNTEDYKTFKKRSFHDVRISYDAKSKMAKVNLEEKGNTCTIFLKPKDPENVIDLRMINFQKVQTPRVLSVYISFWAFHKKYFAKKGEPSSFLDWVDYTNLHLQELHTQYDSLNKHIEVVIKNLKCDCPMPCFDCIPNDSTGGKDTLVKTLLISAGPNRILIIGLGIYNYDKVIPLQNVVTIEQPNFVTSSGRKINAKNTFLILDGIKGTIYTDGKSALNLIAGYKNTLFVVDHANRRYKLVLEPNDPKKGPVFTLEDISNNTIDLEGLEKALMGK